MILHSQWMEVDAFREILWETKPSYILCFPLLTVRLDTSVSIGSFIQYIFYVFSCSTKSSKNQWEMVNPCIYLGFAIALGVK